MKRPSKAQSPLRRQVAELSLRNEFSKALLGAQLDAEQVYELLHSYCCRVVDVPVFCLQLLRSDSNIVHEVIRRERGQRLQPRHVRMTEELRWIAASKQTFLSNHVETYPPPFRPRDLGEPPGSLLTVPLLAGDDLVGAMTLMSFEVDAFGQVVVDTLSAVAAQSAMAISSARAFQAQQLRSRQLTALAQVIREVGATPDLERLFARAVQLVQDALHYDHVAVFSVEPATKRVEFKASTNPVLQARGLADDPEEGLVWQAAQSGESSLANDLSERPRFSFADVLKDTRTEVAVPLKTEGRVVGVLDVQSSHLDTFEPHDLHVLHTLADQLAVSVEDARLYTARQEEAWTSTALLQSAEALNKLDNLDDVLDAAVRITPLLVGVDRCSILLWHEDAQKLDFARGYAGRLEQEPLLDTVRFRPGDSPLLDLVLALPGATPIDACWDAESRMLDESGELEQSDVLVLPLVAQSELQGIMVTDYADPHTLFSDRARAILAGIADRVGMAIANTRLHAAQREEAWVTTALLQVAQAFASSLSLKENLATVARLTSLLVGVDRCMIFLWDREGAAIKALLAHGLSASPLETFQSLQLTAKEMPMIDVVMQTGDSLVVDDAPASDLLPPGFARSFGIMSLLAVPMTSRGETVGLFLVDYSEAPRRFTRRNIQLVEGIAQQAAIAIENAQLYETALEQERVTQELRVARNIQISFLPQVCPSLPGWETAADWHAARGVGGDFYDFVPLESERLGLVIADVSDKGVPAALFMSVTRTLMRASALLTSSPAQVLQRVNELIISDTHSDMFLTLFYGILDWRTGELTYANAGHNPPILRRRRGQDDQPHQQAPNAEGTSAAMASLDAHFVELSAKGMALGVMEAITLEERRVTVQPGDLLILYTDGVTEPINEEEEEFGEQRLLQVLDECWDLPSTEIVQRVHRSVTSFVGEQPEFDDYTLVCLKRKA